MDDLMMEFVAELRDDYAALANDLDKWRAHPANKTARDAVLRYLHTAKGGAGFVKFERIEQLAASAEQALCDFEHWGLTEGVAQATLICDAIGRIEAIATAVEMGIGHTTMGEDGLLAALVGCEINQRRAVPYDQMQTSFIRLRLTVLDQLMSEISEMQTKLSWLEDAPAIARVCQDMTRHAERIRALRYAPLAELFRGINNVVRTLGDARGQVIHFIAHDGGYQLDRTALPLLRNALRHLIRNAVAHGIELPDVRRARGKAVAGTITITATQQDEMLCLEVVDDGAGIDYDVLVDDAVHREQALVNILELVQKPGISAAKQVSALAGRGMGLDIARISIERLGGRLELYDHAPSGFSAQLIFPAKVV